MKEQDFEKTITEVMDTNYKVSNTDEIYRKAIDSMSEKIYDLEGLVLLYKSLFVLLSVILLLNILK